MHRPWRNKEKNIQKIKELKEKLLFLEKELVKLLGKIAYRVEFETKLKEFYENHQDIFTDMVGLGMMRGLRVKDADTLTQFISKAFDNGVLVLKAGRNTLRFLPPLTITKYEVNEGFERLEKAL